MIGHFEKQSNGGAASIKDYKPSFDGGGGGFPFGTASALSAAAQAI